MDTSKRVLGFLGIASVAIIAVASFAWACTVQPYMSVRGSGTAAASTVRNAGATTTASPGSTVTVELANGATAFSGANAVEIRWNDVAGPVLATINARSFSVPVEVPLDAGPGVYYIVAVGRTASGAVFGKVSTTLAVAAPALAPSGSSASGDLWSGFDEGAPSPSLVDTPTAQHTSPAVAGMVLLSVGSVALFGGFGVLAVRRRRATATAPTRR